MRRGGTRLDDAAVQRAVQNGLRGDATPQEYWDERRRLRDARRRETDLLREEAKELLRTDVLSVSSSDSLSSASTTGTSSLPDEESYQFVDGAGDDLSDPSDEEDLASSSDEEGYEGPRTGFTIQEIKTRITTPTRDDRSDSESSRRSRSMSAASLREQDALEFRPRGSPKSASSKRSRRTHSKHSRRRRRRRGSSVSSSSIDSDSGSDSTDEFETRSRAGSHVSHVSASLRVKRDAATSPRSARSRASSHKSHKKQRLPTSDARTVRSRRSSTSAHSKKNSRTVRRRDGKDARGSGRSGHDKKKKAKHDKSRSKKDQHKSKSRRRKRSGKKSGGGGGAMQACGTFLLRTGFLAVIFTVAYRKLLGLAGDFDSVLSDTVPWPQSPYTFSPYRGWAPAETTLSPDVGLDEAVAASFIPAAPFDAAMQSPGTETFKHGAMAVDASGARVIVSGDGILVGYTTETLRAIWSAPLLEADRPRAMSRVRIYDDLVLYPGSCHSLDSFRVADGVSSWSVSLPEGVDACRIVDVAPAAEGKCHVVLTLDGDLIGVDVHAGTVCAPHRKLACPSGTSCVLSRQLATLGRSIFIKSNAMFDVGAQGETDALYSVRLVDADADLRQPFMFRVSKAKALPKGVAHPSGPALVLAALDGQQVVVLHGCHAYGFHADSLQDLWSLDLCGPDYRPLQHVESSPDGAEVVITDDNAVHRLVLSPRGRAPDLAWSATFRSLFPRLHKLEEARVLSAPLVRDNGILVRVGTSRGSARVPIQAGLALIDKGSGAVRWFAASTQLSQGNLAVDAEGGVLSFADGAHLQAEDLVGVDLLNEGLGRRAAAARTGVQRLTCSDWNAAEQELTALAQARLAVASSCANAGWLGRSMKNEPAAKVNAILATTLATQAARAAERTGSAHKASVLNSAAEQARQSSELGLSHLQDPRKVVNILEQVLH